MGKAITQVALTGAAAPSRITSGNDGNVWVADPGTNRVTRITTAAAPVKTNFPVGGHPTGIASAPDGNLYVTEQTGNNLARVTTAGVVSTFAVPTAGSKPARCGRRRRRQRLVQREPRQQDRDVPGRAGPLELGDHATTAGSSPPRRASPS